MAVRGTGGDTMGQLALQDWACPKPPQGCSVAMRDGASQEWCSPSATRAPGDAGPSCSWREPLSCHLGQFPALSPSLGQDPVPGVWTGVLSCPMCCQGFPSPLCGCTSPVPQKRLPGFSPVHTQPVGVCSTNTSLEDAGTFCAGFGAELGSARLGSALPAHVWNKKRCLTPKIAPSPPAMIGEGCFVPENDVGTASPALPLVSV